MMMDTMTMRVILMKMCDDEFHQYAPGAPIEEARIDGNALVTTKMARVDKDAIIPDKTCDAIKYL